MRQEPDTKADHPVEKCRQQSNDWQNFQRKDHLLDVVGVVDYKRRCSVNGFAKQVKNNQASKEHQGEFSFRAGLDVPTPIESDAKDKRLNLNHEERHEERPEERSIRKG